MKDELHCIVYVSSATSLYSRQELDELLAQARAHNAVDDITGCLLYVGGNIMQVLEGPREAVQATYARIAASRRHANVMPILDAPVAAREFPTWSMAFDQPSAERFFALRKAFEDGDTPARSFGLLRQFWTNLR